MHAVMANVDTTPEQVHCTIIFETEGVIQAPQTDLAEDAKEDQEWAEVSDDDTPELLSESESERDIDTDSDDETQCNIFNQAGRAGAAA